MSPSCPSISLFSTQEPAPQNYPLVHIPLRGKRKFFKRPLPLTPRPSHYGLPVNKPSCPHLFPLYLYFLSPLSGIPFAQVHTWPLTQYLQISERTSLPSLSKTAPHLLCPFSHAIFLHNTYHHLTQVYLLTSTCTSGYFIGQYSLRVNTV